MDAVHKLLILSNLLVERVRRVHYIGLGAVRPPFAAPSRCVRHQTTRAGILERVFLPVGKAGDLGRALQASAPWGIIRDGGQTPLQ